MQKIKLIIFGQSITALIYTIVYLLKSFVCWDLVNPFYWIINIPNYDEPDRFLILFYTLGYYGVLYLLIHNNRKQIINFLTLK